jgi:hypothetical protein
MQGLSKGGRYGQDVGTAHWAISTIGNRNPVAEGDEQDRRAARAAESRRLRLAHARANAAWPEITATDLVARGPFLVDPETGDLFQRRRHVYPNGRPEGPINDSDVSAFWVDDDGEPRFVGPPASGPKTIDDLTRKRIEGDQRRAKDRRRR